MLYIGQQVHNIFELILNDIAEFFPDVIHKISAPFQAFSQKDCKPDICTQWKSFGFNLLLMLLPPIQNLLIEKCDGKNN